MRPADRQNPRQTLNIAADQQETEAQLEEQTEGRGSAAIRDYLSRQGVSDEFLGAFLATVWALRSGGGPQLKTTLDHESFRLSRLLQSDGHMGWFQDRAQKVLTAALAIAHPIVQRAFEIFDDRLIDVTADKTSAARVGHA